MKISMKSSTFIIALASVSSALADDVSAQADRNAFVAVANAIVSQYKIASNQSIRAIIKIDSEVFAVQFLDDAGKCSQIMARVSSGSFPDGNSVIFPRTIPTGCLNMK